jgi:hypothetical protein
MTDALKRRLAGASVVLFDDTLWRDDEMIQLDVGPKTGRRMGHMRGDSMRQASNGRVPLQKRCSCWRIVLRSPFGCGHLVDASTLPSPFPIPPL